MDLTGMDWRDTYTTEWRIKCTEIDGLREYSLMENQDTSLGLKYAV